MCAVVDGLVSIVWEGAALDFVIAEFVCIGMAKDGTVEVEVVWRGDVPVEVVWMS